MADPTPTLESEPTPAPAPPPAPAPAPAPPTLSELAAACETAANMYHAARDKAHASHAQADQDGRDADASHAVLKEAIAAVQAAAAAEDA